MNNLVKGFLVLKMGRIFQKKFILKNLIRRSTYINSDVDSGGTPRNLGGSERVIYVQSITKSTPGFEKLSTTLHRKIFCYDQM